MGKHKRGNLKWLNLPPSIERAKKTIKALNQVSNPKTTVLANIMFEAQRKERGR